MGALKKLSVGTLRKRAGVLKKQTPASDAVVADAMTLMVTWPFIHGFATSDGFLMSIGVGLFGAIAMFLAGALVTGILESATDRNEIDVFGWLATVSVAGLYWWSDYSWPAIAALALITFGGSAYYWRSELRKKAHDPTLRGLPVELALTIGKLPRKLSQSLRQPLDAALSDYSDLHELLTVELAEDSAVDTDAMLRDAALTVSEITERVRLQLRLQKMAKKRESETVHETLAQSRKEIERLRTSLHTATDAVIVYAAARQQDSATRLQEQAENLRLVAAGMKELDEMLGDGPAALTAGEEAGGEGLYAMVDDETVADVEDEETIADEETLADLDDELESGADELEDDEELEEDLEDLDEDNDDDGDDDDDTDFDADLEEDFEDDDLEPPDEPESDAR